MTIAKNSTKTDILLLGATGFTGRLILKYLIAHPSRRHSPRQGDDVVTLAIAGRSLPRLREVADACGGGFAESSGSLGLRQINDITDSVEVRNLISDVHVVISAVGPFWRHGRVLVKVCAEMGVHYVDITGEGIAPSMRYTFTYVGVAVTENKAEKHFIKYCVDQCDELARKTRSIIINAAGFDSVPSDLSAFLSVRAIKLALGPNARAAKSTSAFALRNPVVSGGSIATLLDILGGAVPEDALHRASEDAFSLSPVKGVPAHARQLVSHLPLTSLVGSIFVMASVNSAVVRRSWGLYQHEAHANSEMYGPDAYGDEFDYDEFNVQPNWFASLIKSLILVIGAFALRHLPPVRWLFGKFVPRPGDGPSEEKMREGWMQVTNVTMVGPSSDQPHRAVKTTMKGKGDGGYLLTSVMTSEIALALLPSQRGSLTHMALEGGVLTPVTALGDGLKTRLESTGLFTFESELIEIGDGGTNCDRKSR